MPGEKEYTGRGVSFCASCDGFFFRDQEVAVVGGGDTAVSDALELSHHARQVFLVHRRDQLRAGQVLVQRASAESRIEFVWNSVVEEVIGDQMVNGLKLQESEDRRKQHPEAGGSVCGRGCRAQQPALRRHLEDRRRGQHQVDHDLGTSVPGVFAAGDVRQHSPRQIGSAVGDGITAALSAARYIQTRA